jgi:hypothetical protein
MKKSYLFFCLLMVSGTLSAQVSKTFPIQKTATVSPLDFVHGYEARIDHLEAPAPGGDSFRGHLRELRKEVRKTYPPKDPTKTQKSQEDRAPNPGILRGWTKIRKFPNGLELPLTGGIPNDNTLAISKDSILLSAINSVLWAYDLKGDTMLFPNTIVSLQFMARGFSSENYYDPKLYYDEKADRFILTFLGNNRPENSKVMMCFSSSNNPLDPWHVYTIPGNPLNNNRWTDFPALSVTDDEVFYTANFIIPDVSWQLGFDGSMIWQIDKEAGYGGAATLPTKLWSDIRHNGRFTRNLFPVPGADGDANAVHFLSNRNFDITNDTIFVFTLEGKIDDPNADLRVVAARTDVPYGLAPNGRQSNTNLNDPTSGLDVNDARVLGGFLLDNTIQFVSTTVNPETGLAAIYHGFVSEPESSEPKVWGRIIGHDTLDLAYPNIAWTGLESCQGQSIIGFNFTSPTDFAGVGCVFFSNDSLYSDILRLKNGEGFVSRLPGTYDRWGDYFGLQRDFQNPRQVYLAGFYGLQTNNSGTWLAALVSADTIPLDVNLTVSGNPGACRGTLRAQGIGGLPPYSYRWIAPYAQAGSEIENVCKDSRATVIVTDALGCEARKDFDVDFVPIGTDNIAFPVPFTDFVSLQFDLPRNGKVIARLYDSLGRNIDEIISRNALQGRNELSFFTNHLPSGSYTVVVIFEDKELFSKKIVRP